MIYKVQPHEPLYILHFISSAACSNSNVLWGMSGVLLKVGILALPLPVNKQLS